MTSTRPRICVDLTPNEMHDRFGGIGRYATHLCRELALLDEETRGGAEIYGLATSVGRPEPAREALERSAALGAPVHTEWHRLRRTFVSGSRLRAGGIDLFHSTQPFALPLVRSGKCVMTSYDLISIVLPRPGGASTERRWAQARALVRYRMPDHIVAISDCTKRDIVRELRIAPEKITTVHLGVDTAQFAPESDSREARAVLDRLRLPPRFFVFVSSDHYRKNHELLFRAWLRVADEIPEALVLVGKEMYTETFRRIDAEVRARGLAGRVLWRDGVTDAELPNVYRAATALCNPSLYEGFGMTILEAMGAGSPVAASRNGAHEEVGLDACLYFDPTSEGELAARLAELSRDGELRTRLREKGFARARQLSWSAMARATMHVYRRLLAF